VIRSFRCKRTEALFAGKACHRDWRSFRNVAERKLQMLNRAVILPDLKIPPNNCLEALNRDRVGQHSIRINDQYRVCFVWTPDGPTEVEIVDSTNQAAKRQ
jgi:toxin HigB-1